VSFHLLSALLLPAGGAISALQFHAVRLACARHDQKLPDGSRAGFFLGDGEAHKRKAQCNRLCQLCLVLSMQQRCEQ
jgi:hypothetical protein